LNHDGPCQGGAARYGRLSRSSTTNPDTLPDGARSAILGGMASPPSERSPLYSIAAELEAHAHRLRLRAAMVGASTQSMRWNSPGARAFARNTADLSSALINSANRIERTAQLFREQALRHSLRAAGVRR